MSQQRKLALEKITVLNNSKHPCLRGTTLRVDWQTGVGGRVVAEDANGYAYISPRTGWGPINAFLYGYMAALEQVEKQPRKRR